MTRKINLSHSWHYRDFCQIVKLILFFVQIDSGKVRTEEGRHSGLFSFIRRNSLGDKKPLPNAASNVQQLTVSSDSTPVAPTADSRQNHDGILFLL